MGGGAEKMLSTLTRSLPEDKYEIDILEIGKFGMHEEKINKNTRVLKPMLNNFTDNKLINFIKWQCVKYFPYLLRAFRTKNKKYDYGKTEKLLLGITVVFTTFCRKIPIEKK